MGKSEAAAAGPTTWDWASPERTREKIARLGKKTTGKGLQGDPALGLRSSCVPRGVELRAPWLSGALSQDGLCPLVCD